MSTRRIALFAICNRGIECQASPHDMRLRVERNLLICCALILTASKSYGREVGGPWTSPSSWFRPVPESNLVDLFRNWRFLSSDEVNIPAQQIPAQLICTVSPKFRDRAARLLGTSDIIPLSDRQCRGLSCDLDTDRLFSQAIADKQRKLDSIFGHKRLHRGMLVEDSSGKVARTEKDQAPLIANLRREITILQKWRRTARPFLVKAVALSEGSGGLFGFSALMFHDKLTIHHESSGRAAVPMKNVPLVIFLEREPTKVYHTLTMWPGPPKPLEPLIGRDEAAVEPWHHQ
jgi:hypothetical protein